MEYVEGTTLRHILNTVSGGHPRPFMTTPAARTLIRPKPTRRPGNLPCSESFPAAHSTPVRAGRSPEKARLPPILPVPFHTAENPRSRDVLEFT